MRHILVHCLLLGVAVGLVDVVDLKTESAQSKARRLKDHHKKKKNHDEVIKTLKAAIVKLQEEKQGLSNEIKMNAEQAASKAQLVSQLTSQVAEKDNVIKQMKEEVGKKNPACAQDDNSVDSQRTAQLTQEGVRQQKEIANLTSALSAMKIKYQLLEEEYGDPSLRYFLAAKATKTFKYVLPHISEAFKTGEEARRCCFSMFGSHEAESLEIQVYSAMNTSLFEGMHSLLGSESSVEPWLPMMSAFLVYGMICCPIGLVLSYIVDFVCSVREILLACGFYLVCVSALSCGFVAATQRDPLKELAQNDTSILLLQQLGFAGILVVYLVLLGVATCSAACNDKLPFSVILARLMQILCRKKIRRCLSSPLPRVASTCVLRFFFAEKVTNLRVSFMLIFALTYYRLVWTPTMLDELPLVQEIFSRDVNKPSILPYLLTLMGFSGNFVLEWKAGSIDTVAPEEKDGKGA
eukprot:symbB.v1.2.019467.t1/scaffold1593.1/size164412/9